MTKHPIALAIALAFAASIALTGCDRTSNLTDQEHIQRAKDFEAKGDLKAAIIEFKNALRKKPDNAQARWLLGLLYVKADLGGEAEKELLKARQLGVNDESIKYPLGEALLLQHEYKRVLEVIQAGNQTTPRNRAGILRLHGDAMLGLGKLGEACPLYRQSLEIDKAQAPSYWGLANCAMAKKNLSEARAHLDNAINVDPNNADTWAAVGDFERYSKNTQAAETAYTTALKHKPNHLLARFNRAILYISAGKMEAAQADLGKIRQIAPRHVIAHYLQALIEAGSKKSEAALQSVQQALVTGPDFMPAVLLLGTLQFEQKAYNQSAKNLERYLNVYPGNLEVRKLLAAIYLKLKQPEQALAVLTPFLEKNKDDVQLLALAGEAYLRNEDPGQADAYFEKAAKLDPSNIALQTQLGLSRLVAGDTERAEARLTTASALGSKQYQADVALVRLYLSKKQYDKALVAVSALEKKFPNSPATHNLKGGVYYAKQDYAQARQSFEKALKLKPGFFPAASNLAQLDVNDKNPAAAHKRLEAVLTQDKSNLKATLALAFLARNENKEKDFVRWLEKAVREHPNEVRPREHLAEYYLAKKTPEKALNLAREVSNTNPGNAEAISLLGRMQLASGQTGNAVASYTRLTQIEPKSALVYFQLGKAQAAANNEAGTRKALRQALEIRPDFLDARVALVALESRTGHLMDALSLAQQAQRLHPQSYVGFLLEGDVLLLSKRFAEAAKAYEKALGLEPLPDLVVKRHLAQVRAGDVKNADTGLQAWLQSHPKDKSTWFYYAQSLESRGLNQQAIAQYSEVLRLAPDDPGVLNNLAMLYHKERDARARATAEKAYRLAPQHPLIADTLGWMLVEQGEAGRGLELLRKANAAAPKASEIRFHYAVALAKTGDKVQARKELQGLLAANKPFPQREAATAWLAQLQ